MGARIGTHHANPIIEVKRAIQKRNGPVGRQPRTIVTKRINDKDGIGTMIETIHVLITQTTIETTMDTRIQRQECMTIGVVEISTTNIIIAETIQTLEGNFVLVFKFIH